MLSETEDAAIQSDSYIDALLAAHERKPVPLVVTTETPEPSVRYIIRLLEKGLPRFHPSFLFEERLAEQLRAAAGMRSAGAGAGSVVIDRRVLVGGALASGVSIAGAAMLAWRRRRD